MRKKVVYVHPKRNANVTMQYTMNLLLLTFFVALISFSNADKQKQNMGFASLMGGFGILPGGKSPFQNEIGRDVAPDVAPIMPTQLDVGKLRMLMARSGPLDGTGVTKNAQGITITLRGDVLFEGRTDRFNPAGLRHLENISGIIKDLDNRIILSAYTDSRPIEDAPYYSNWAYSSARALAVMQYLASKGVRYQRMSIYGMGSQNPITSNDNEAGRHLNDRIEITLAGSLSGTAQKELTVLTPKTQPTVKAFKYKGFEFKFEEQ
ncbi:MAG: OmpA family protein [Syntrophaceae bacterium]